MAKVMQDPKLREWVEDFLEYVTRRWSTIPELAAEWDEWDEESRFTFALDWPICEDRLHQLKQLADRSMLTAAQQVRYRELVKLVAKNRPLLDEMLKKNA